MMKKSNLKKILTLILIFTAFSCQKKKQNLVNLPDKITIVKKSGISARASHIKSSSKVGAVYHNQSYQVLDGIPAYYQINLNNKDKIGWISANIDNKWTKQTDKKVTILRKGGLAVRENPYDSKSKLIGTTIPGDEYTILNIDYLHLKVLLPNY
jgi:hypothetical protein